MEDIITPNSTPDGNNIEQFTIHLMTTIKKKQIQFMSLDKFQVDSNQIISIKDLKYYIIDRYKSQKFCPCILIISVPFEDGYFCAEVNDMPDAKLIDYFPDGDIFINILNDVKCDCGFHELANLSKLEIFEKYIKRINDLKKFYNLQIAQKNEKIKEYEENCEELVKIIDNLNKKIENNNIKLTKEVSGNNDKIQCEKDNNLNSCKNIISISNNYFNVKFEDFYDVVIDIKSIKDVNKGWEIKMNEIGEKRFNEFKNQKTLVIGVIGNSNKGKSFILSRISKIELPNGTSIRTEGLSIKYPDLTKNKNGKIVLLDSAGLETPVLNDNLFLRETGLFDNYQDNNILKNGYTNELNEKLMEKAKEKLITELFLQNFILFNSDILITVVGILTYSEQKLLNRIKSELIKLSKNKNNNNTLFVIHNLMTFTTVKQVRQYISDYLLKSATFDLKKRTMISTEKSNKKKSMNVEYFIEKSNNLKIFHLIFANEGSDAGNYYNNFTLNFFEKYYQNIIDIKTFDIIKKTQNRFIELSKELIDKNISINENDFLDYKDMIIRRQIKLKENKEIILKRCYLDELGFSNLRNNGFNPQYNVYEKDDKLIIRIEAPGNTIVKYKIKYSDRYTIIELTGIKKIDIEPNKIEDNNYNSREFGEFTIQIPTLKRLANKEPKFLNKNGLDIFEFELDK